MPASSQTVVSHNEIVMFCRKALEGLGVSTGEMEDAADAVGWLALHGIDSIAPFHNLLAEQPSNSPLRPISRTAFDGAGNSCLFIGPTALDIGFAQAPTQQDTPITLKNCRHPLFLLASMIRCAGRGSHLAARWQEPANQSEFVITIEAGKTFPTLLHTFILNNTPHKFAHAEKEPQLIPSRDLVDLTLHVSPHRPLDSTSLCAPQDPHRTRREYPPAHFQAQQRYHIENGITVDATPWAAIQEIGKLVLVEATEESRRRGAGESA